MHPACHHRGSHPQKAWVLVKGCILNFKLPLGFYDLRIVCVSPDDMSLAAFDKHLQPAGPHIDMTRTALLHTGCLFGHQAPLPKMGFLQLGA